MYTISDSMHVDAPIERCFLLSTSIDLVARTLEMQPIGGKTSGLIEANDQILWRGWKLGLPHLHETVITGYEWPTFFQDSMGRGRFKRFQHEHTLAQIGRHTLLQDKIRFSLPFGLLGDIVAKYIVVHYIARALRRRLTLLKRVAESEEWRQYLPDYTG
jgi:ligand-binding SRPBCC domain-containing protein